MLSAWCLRFERPGLSGRCHLKYRRSPMPSAPWRAAWPLANINNYLLSRSFPRAHPRYLRVGMRPGIRPVPGCMMQSETLRRHRFDSIVRPMLSAGCRATDIRESLRQRRLCLAICWYGRSIASRL